MLQLLVVLSPQVVVAAMRVVVILLRSAAISQIALVPRRNNAPAKMAVVEKKPVIVLAMPSAVPVRSVPALAVRKRQPVNKQKAVANCPSAVRNMKLAALRRPTAAPSRNLAARMIQLSGAKNVKIEYTGLREGEKLYEEVLGEEENTKPTFHNKIRIAEVREYDYEEVNREIEELIAISKNFDDMATVKKMKEIVPEYKSNNSVYEVLDA